MVKAASGGRRRKDRDVPFTITFHVLARHYTFPSLFSSTFELLQHESLVGEMIYAWIAAVYMGCMVGHPVKAHQHQQVHRAEISQHGFSPRGSGSKLL